MPDSDDDILSKVRQVCMSTQSESSKRRRRPLLGRAVVHVYARVEFEHEFESFAKAHIEPFLDASEAKEGEDRAFSADEQRHEFFEVYQKYLACFERRIQASIEEHGDLTRFMEAARDCLNSTQAGDMNRFFLEALLSTTEYTTFCGLMMNEAKRLRFERQSHK